MKVPTVDRFLFYFDLTTGGLILGYVGAIINVGIILMLLMELIDDYREFKRDVLRSFASGEEENVEEEFIDDYSNGVFLILAFVIFLILAICVMISMLLIDGINRRDPRKVRYFLAVMAVGIIKSFIRGIFTLSFMWILVGMVNVYLMIVIYSLYQVLTYEDLDQAKKPLNSLNENETKCCDLLEKRVSEFNEP